jgi:hypothetical protein
MPHQYVDPDIHPHPLMGNVEVEKEALAEMRERLTKWPRCKWAAAQCVDLGSRDVGHLKFYAVGPENTMQTINQKTIGHWSYYFVGWVNLETGKIVPELHISETTHKEDSDHGSNLI